MFDIHFHYYGSCTGEKAVEDRTLALTQAFKFSALDCPPIFLALTPCVMASTLLLILDDISTEFTYSGPQNWNVNQQSTWYGGTTTYPAFANVSAFGSLEVSFEGTFAFFDLF